MRGLLWGAAVLAAVWVPAEGRAAPKFSVGVSWADQVVRATGSGAPNLNAANPAQARLGAEKAAQLDAFRNLLAQVQGIEISAGKKVAEAMGQDEVRGRVEGLLRGFKVVAKRYFSDGGVEIDVEVPLAALTDTLLPPVVAREVAKTAGTGLVVDASGLGASMVLAPRLLDESGATLYGPETLTADARKSTAVASYVKTLAEAKKSVRAGERPIVVKASKAVGGDLVLAADEAKKLVPNAAFLAAGQVVIVSN